MFSQFLTLVFIFSGTAYRGRIASGLSSSPDSTTVTILFSPGLSFNDTEGTEILGGGVGEVKEE